MAVISARTTIIGFFIFFCHDPLFTEQSERCEYKKSNHQPNESLSKFSEPPQRLTIARPLPIRISKVFTGNSIYIFISLTNEGKFTLITGF